MRKISLFLVVILALFHVEHALAADISVAAETWIALVKKFLEAAAQISFGVMIIATVVVRLTPNKKDDEQVGELSRKTQKILAYLPTVGINPNTRKLEDALAEMQKNDK